MAAAQSDTDDLMDSFLEQRGHDVRGWEESYNKKQCPECGAVHDTEAATCSVCGWGPA